MTDQFRALCAELATTLAERIDDKGDAGPYYTHAARLAARARALLAQPEGTDGEVPRIGHILRLAEIIREVDGKHDKGAAALAEAILSHPGIRSAGLTAALTQPEAEGPTDEELDSFLVDVACQHGNVYYSDPLILAHAVLTRWGRPAAQPVAVSERLPSAADCDEQGRCWLGGRQMGSGTPTWLLGYPAWAERFPDVHRFWLPANALPTPEATND